jgi:Na+-transporting methylmalonyl-CoA/oxaloacetate decarboxylase gamma subunit
MLFLAAARTTEQLTEVSLSEGLLMSVIGVAVVFLALIAIMLLTKLQSALIMSFQKKRDQETAAPVPAAPAAGRTPAPGTVALSGVEDKMAAMIMAIVADEMNTPLNELRFISIKEI